MEQKKYIFDKKESDSYCSIRELKERGKPVYIYGIKSVAERAAQKLADNGITISGYFADNIEEGEAVTKDNFPVFTFQQVMELPEADVVIGFHQFGIAYSKIEKGELYNNGKVFIINPELLFDYDYYIDNREAFEQTYNWLEDDLSKDTMKAYMDGNMNGFMRPMADCYVPNQYFIPEVTFHANEVYIDCGMYDGDTIIEFMNRCSDYAYIVGFEPDKNNIEKFKLRGLNMDKLAVYNKGVWSKEAVLGFSADGTSASSVAESGETLISVMSIDSLNLKEPVTFIKMDIEGSELEALRGAEDTIRRDMPKLAICVYHKKEDLITIPQYIKSLESAGHTYSFFLRHHSLYRHETVLYAIPTVSKE